MKIRRLWNVVMAVALLALSPAALAAGGGGWSPPANLSGWQPPMEMHRLALGADGTQAVFWVVYGLPFTYGELWARVRPPGGEWSPAANVSGPVGPLMLWMGQYWNVGVAPDGTVQALWTVRDTSQPPDSDVRVMAATRPPGGTWTAPEPFSGWVTMVRSAGLHVGPDGDMAAVWVACATDSSTLADGPCDVQVRRRPPGAPAWTPAAVIDFSPAGIGRAHARVGPGGLIVAVWVEAAAMMPSSWAVMARAYLPATGMWELSPAELSGWIEPREPNADWLAWPVMGPDGTVVVAWIAKTGAGSAQDAQYSNTRVAATGTWSAPPAKISADRDAGELGPPRLAIGQNGTVAAAWERRNAAGQQAVYANARDPGGAWGAEAQVSATWLSDVFLSGLEVWPGGTAVVLWQAEDAGRPATADEGLFWSARPPSGAWGGGGQGQLGNWVDRITGAALALRGDGSGAAVWAEVDAGQPANQQAGVRAAIWPAGGPWGAPETLAAGYIGAGVWEGGVKAGPAGGAIAAAWLIVRDVPNPADPGYAVFFSEWPAWRVYLPVMLR
jgi:hypothetical protein